MSLQWICVPFVLMSPHTLDISQTLMNNTLHAPWIGKPELKKTWIMIDDFLYFVRKQQYVQYQIQSSTLHILSVMIHKKYLITCN